MGADAGIACELAGMDAPCGRHPLHTVGYASCNDSNTSYNWGSVICNFLGSSINYSHRCYDELQFQQ